MKINNLTLIVTDDCNFNCSYCCQQKEKKSINKDTIREALDLFYPLLRSDDKACICFYGGEPLLAYEQVKYAVGLLEEKNKTGNKPLEFLLTTNGSLVTGEILDFFERHEFKVSLSFDGLAQELGRKRNTLAQMMQVMKLLQARPGIKPEIMSVFSPRTVRFLSESLRFIVEQEGPDITFNLTTMEEWNQTDLEILKCELERLADFLVIHYAEQGKIPVRNFQAPVPVKRGGIFRCSAGENRIAVTPQGDLWGCSLFHDYFKTRQDHPQYNGYYFGRMEDFSSRRKNRYPEIRSNYSELRQNYFRVKDKFCFLCRDVEGCAVCPVNAAYSTGSLGEIAPRQCELLKLQGAIRGDFQQRIRNN